MPTLNKKITRLTQKIAEYEENAVTRKELRKCRARIISRCKKLGDLYLERGYMKELTSGKLFEKISDMHCTHRKTHSIDNNN